MNACQICHNSAGNRTIIAREMMFGWRDEFPYLECSVCGCLQIAQVPQDLWRYYPADYFREPDAWLLEKQSLLRSFLKRQRTHHALGGLNPLGALVAHLIGQPACIDWAWLRRTGVGLHSAILDVGCGTGSLLLRLRKEGFSNLTGIDPFIDRDRAYDQVRIFKNYLTGLEEQFDLVMSHHAFEHVPDPLDTLQQIGRVLRPNGFALVRIPIAGCYAWKYYGVDWVQLDAPRHLFLHSRRSIELLAHDAGLEVADVVFDSTDFQFWGSEQYRRGIALVNPSSQFVNPSASIFSEIELQQFQVQAAELNRLGTGDSACFYLRRSTRSAEQSALQPAQDSKVSQRSA